MARLAWLLLFAFCTTFAQVQPVDVRLLPEKKCDCCEEAGDCGRPDCGLPPAAAQPSIQMRTPAEVTPKRASVAPRAAHENFILPPIRLARTTVTKAEPGRMDFAGAPLFQRYCSFLI